MTAVFLLTLRQLSGRWRLSILTVLASLPVLIALLIVSSSDAPTVQEFENSVLSAMLAGSISPLIVLSIATAAFAIEVEDRTLANLTLSPIPRWQIVVPKLLAAIFISAPFISISALFTGFVAFSGDWAATVAVTAAAFIGVALYSSAFVWLGLKTTRAIGYGLLWWVFREPRFKQYGMAAALGVGNQMIAVLPDIDLVIVNRANTYQGEGTPTPALLDLIEAVLEARIGTPRPDPELEILTVSAPDPRLNPVPDSQLAEFAGEWPYPPTPLGLPQRTTVSTTIDNGALVAFSEVSGTFREYLQPDGTFVEEDSLEQFVPIRDGEGSFAGIADIDTVARAAIAAAAVDEMKKAAGFLSLVDDETGFRLEVARATIDLLGGRSKKAEKALRELAETENPGRVEANVNQVGYTLLQAERLKPAARVFELNTELFPEASNTWDSLGEAFMNLGEDAKAISCYEKSLELNPENTNAEEMIARIRKEASDSTN